MASHDTKLEFQIAKLCDDNYRTWKTEMKWYLKGKGLLDHVLGKVNLEESATAAEKKIYRINNDKALAAIGLHVEPDQQIHVEDCDNAHEAWTALEQIYQPKNRVRIMQLKKTFYHLKMREDETMSSYVARSKISASNLKEAGAEVSDEDLAYTLLAGLPDSYENLNMALASLPDDKFTSKEVKRVLLAEYERRKSRIDNDVGTSKEALQTSKNSKNVRYNKAPSTSDATKTGLCFNCKKPGHYARNCRLKVSNKYAPIQNKGRKNLDAFLVSLNNLDIDESWLLDSGCTHHVCKRKDWFQNFREIESEAINTAANADKEKSATLHAKGIGDIVLKAYVGEREKGIVLRNVYYVPDIRKNLMSVSQIERKGKEFLIRDGKIKIRNMATKQVMCEAYRKNDLYVVRAEVDMDTKAPIETHALSMRDNDLWHRRFCHVSTSTIEKLAEQNRVRGLDNAKINEFKCDACSIGKSVKSPCTKVNGRQSTDVCELIHTDVCGPMPVESLNGNRYFITFTDDFSRKTTVMCIKSKDEVTECVKRYIARIEREKDKKVKRFRSDNGLEYCNRQLTDYFKSVGIKHERSNVETPQMNGVAERINRTLLDLVRTMLKSAQLPQKFWAEAVTSAAYIRDRVGHSSLKGETPLAIWTSRTPSVSHLRVYGCLAFAHLPKQGRKKLDDRAVECILVGYASQTKGYRLWCPKKSDVIITKHVQFAEDKIGFEWSYKGSLSHNYKYNNIWSEEDSEGEIETVDKGKSRRQSIAKERTSKESPNNKAYESHERREEPNEIGKIVGAEAETPKQKGRPKKVIKNPYGRKGKPKAQNEISRTAGETSDSESQNELEINLLEVVEPNNLQEALSSPQAKKWKQAIAEEINSLEERNSWEIVDLPAGRPCIGCRWVFKVKTDSEGKVNRYKARLVAQGFTQEKGIDYEDIYSPVASFSIIRLMIAFAVTFKWQTRHFDIKCAYLYGKLKEELYMKVPPLYKTEEGKVARLMRPIYGLKQSGRYWNNEINDFLIRNGFKRLQSSNCVYRVGHWLIVIVYVDDIFVFSRKADHLHWFTNLINKQYETKDLGEITFALGVKVEWDESGNAKLSQKAYVQSILTRFGMIECRGADTPLEPGTKLSKQDSPKSPTQKEEMSKVPYRELIGSLMYLSRHTRPDILFAVTKLSQYNTNPRKEHWEQAKHILRYLNRTKDYVIQYRVSHNPIIDIYCDADWAGDLDDRHSFSGMVVTLGQNLIQWQSSKQRGIATSTMEAEYTALATGVKEAIWMETFLRELDLTKFFPRSFEMHCDNRAAIDFSKNRIEKSRTKHIDIAYHVVREKLEEGLVHLSYIASNENVADIMTKSLKSFNHKNMVCKLRLNVAKVGD